MVAASALSVPAGRLATGRALAGMGQAESQMPMLISM
jgi:hypothetical protein